MAWGQRWGQRRWSQPAARQFVQQRRVSGRPQLIQHVGRRTPLYQAREQRGIMARLVRR